MIVFLICVTLLYPRYSCFTQIVCQIITFFLFYYPNLNVIVLLSELLCYQNLYVTVLLSLMLCYPTFFTIALPVHLFYPNLLLFHINFCVNLVLSVLLFYPTGCQSSTLRKVVLSQFECLTSTHRTVVLTLSLCHYSNFRTVVYPNLYVTVVHSVYLC